MDRPYLSPEELRGLAAERRFLELIQSGNESLPSWILGGRLAPPLYDAQGVDCLVTIERPDSSTVTVPVQIKSSHGHAIEHLIQNPSHWFWRVIIIIVNDELTDEELAKQLTGELRHARLRHYNFEELFATIECNPEPPIWYLSILAGRHL